MRKQFAVKTKRAYQHVAITTHYKVVSCREGKKAATARKNHHCAPKQATVMFVVVKKSALSFPLLRMARKIKRHGKECR